MLTKFYKLIFDLSICFMIGGFVLNYFWEIQISGSGFLSLLLTALITVSLDKKRVIRIVILILIPFCYLVLTLPVTGELVVFIIIWAYFIYVSMTNRLSIGRGELVDFIKKIIILSLFLVFPMIINFRNFSTAVQVVSPYLLSACVCMAFLLRHLRGGNEMEQMKSYRRQQFIELLIFLVICLILTLVKAPQHLIEGLGIIYHNIIIPVLVFLASIVGMILYGIVYLLAALISVITKEQKTEQVKVLFGDNITSPNEILKASTAREFSVLPLIYTIGGIAVVILVFILFRWLMGEMSKQNIPTGITETRENLDDIKKKRDKLKANRPDNPRESVRYYYRKYMRWLQRKQVLLTPKDTTREIYKKYNDILAGDIEEKGEVSTFLNKLYQNARYQTTKEITEEEAETVKQLYQEIKNTKVKK